jgi:hypothetical protein
LIAYKIFSNLNFFVLNFKIATPQTFFTSTGTTRLDEYSDERELPVKNYL